MAKLGLPHGRLDRNILDYEFELKTEELCGERLEVMLVEQSNTKWFYWVDACCGEGCAIRTFLAKYGKEERIFGIDRNEEFSPENGSVGFKYEKRFGKRHMYNFLAADISDVVLRRKASIMTCVRGMAWLDPKVAGPTEKKMDAIKNLFQYVKVGGKFFFNDVGEYRQEDFSKMERLLKSKVHVWEWESSYHTRTVSSIMLVKR